MVVPLWHSAAAAAAAGASWCLCVPLHLFIGHPSQPGLPTFLSNSSSQTDKVLIQTFLLFFSGKKWGEMGVFVLGDGRERGGEGSFTSYPQK